MRPTVHRRPRVVSAMRAEKPPCDVAFPHPSPRITHPPLPLAPASPQSMPSTNPPAHRAVSEHAAPLDVTMPTDPAEKGMSAVTRTGAPPCQAPSHVQQGSLLISGPRWHTFLSRPRRQAQAQGVRSASPNP